jgi:N6-L-threonylcarbamoyladenine synthase
MSNRVSIVILGIESSCDETAASVIIDGVIKSNVIATQEIHAQYGGVVPEVASRAHQQMILPVVLSALREADVKVTDLSAIACTQGPGLLGALLVGHSFAKGMAIALDIPLLGVHHMQAHILAHFIDEPKPTFPFLCLTVSGGHTQIVRVDGPLKMQILGTTQDDAVGEAFDKTARLLGYEYPGGRFIDKAAQNGDPLAFSFPKKINLPGYDYSFSGVKTAFQLFIKKQDQSFIDTHHNDIAASIQHTLVELLVEPLIRASLDTSIKSIAIAGGVAANSGLRQRLAKLGEDLDWEIFIPDFSYCTDNAAMVAMAGHFMFEAGIKSSLLSSPNPSMEFIEAS